MHLITVIYYNQVIILTRIECDQMIQFLKIDFEKYLHLWNLFSFKNPESMPNIFSSTNEDQLDSFKLLAYASKILAFNMGFKAVREYEKPSNSNLSDLSSLRNQYDKRGNLIKNSEMIDKG